MSLLTICQEAADASNIDSPETIIGNTDPAARMLLIAAKTEGRNLSRRHSWPTLTEEGTFTSVAAELQGTWGSLGGGSADYSDFSRLKPQTMWNRSQNRPIPGPLTAKQWQARKSSTSSGPYQEFIIRGTKLHLYPSPTSGQTIAFDYITKNWCESAGGDGQDNWQADTDTAKLDEHIIMLGVVWRYKKSRGFMYAEDFRSYEIEVANEIARDGGKRPLDLSGQSRDGVYPGLTVPEGNWNL